MRYPLDTMLDLLVSDMSIDKKYCLIIRI
ncbi:hypothetical protein [Rhodohalobacter sulfatireducens]